MLKGMIKGTEMYKNFAEVANTWFSRYSRRSLNEYFVKNQTRMATIDDFDALKKKTRFSLKLNYMSVLATIKIG